MPGEDLGAFEQELSEIVSHLSRQDPKFRARYSMGYWAGALETCRETPIAQTLLECAQKVVGPGVNFGAQTFWADSSLLSQAGITSVLFGPGGAGLHSTVEYVRLEDVALCAETLFECAKAFCGS